MHNAAADPENMLNVLLHISIMNHSHNLFLFMRHFCGLITLHMQI